jgi:hypothetical protein
VVCGLLPDGSESRSFLIPSKVWLNPNTVFVDRDYETPGQKSQPEWGINSSCKNLAALEPYALALILENLSKCSDA